MTNLITVIILVIIRITLVANLNEKMAGKMKRNADLHPGVLQYTNGVEDALHHYDVMSCQHAIIATAVGGTISDFKKI